MAQLGGVADLGGVGQVADLIGQLLVVLGHFGAHVVDLHEQVDVGDDQRDQAAGDQRGEEVRALGLGLRVERWLWTHVQDSLRVLYSIDGTKGGFGFNNE